MHLSIKNLDTLHYPSDESRYKKFMGDLVLIKLKTKLNFTNSVRPACIDVTPTQKRFEGPLILTGDYTF